MSVMIFIMCCVCVSSLSLGVISILHQEARNEASITFFFLCLANALLCFGYANVLDNNSLESIVFFRYFIIAGLISTVLIATLLIMILSDNKKRSTMLVLAFFTVTGIIFAVLASNGDNIVLTNNEPNTISYTFKHAIGIYGVAANTFFVSLYTAYLLWDWRKSAEVTREKQQARAFSTAYAFLAVSIILVVLIPINGVVMPPLSGVFVYVFIVSVYLISRRYRTFTISFENIAGLIYSDVIIPIVVTDRHEKVVLVNEAAITFFELDQNTLHKSHIHDLIVKPDTISAPGDNDIRETIGFQAETVNGNHAVNVMRSDTVDKYGDLMCSLYMIKDITEAKQLISSLNEAVIEAEIANKAKSSFLANISHEIRTPMNAIIGMAEIALQNNENPELHTNLQSIRSAGLGLVTIINDILDFSKIESGKMEIIEREYLLTSVIVDIVNMFAIKLSNSDVQFLVEVNPEIPVYLIGDEIRVKQILVNIIGNAVKFTHEGSITLEIDGTYAEDSEDGYILQFKVVDTGIGIREEDIPKLFATFSQVDTRKNRNVKGTGLGLSITRTLCQMMDGDIEVESTYGKGSSFSVHINQKAKPDNAYLAQVDDTSNKLVAIYEPDESLRAVFDRLLTNLDVSHVMCATTADYIKTLENPAITHTTVRAELISNEIEDATARVQDSVKLILVSNYYDKPHAVLHCSEVYLPFFSFQMADILNERESVIMTKERDADYSYTPLPDVRVLVVDDTYVNLQVAQGLLAPYKMTVDTALNGREAIAKVKQNDYDLIFMDHMMPEMDGVDTTSAIRQMGGKYEELIIVALTANALTGAKEMFLSRGFNDFIAKPIEISKLKAVVKKWLIKKGDENPEARMPAVSADKPALLPERVTEIGQSKEDLLDYDKGLALLGNNEELFFSILKTYVSELDEKIATLESTHQRGELSLYGITAHSIKSSSQTLGIKTIPELALALEDAGREGDSAFVKSHHGEFLDRLASLKCELARRFCKQIGLSEADGPCATEVPRKAASRPEIDRQLLEDLFEAVDFCDPKRATAVFELIRAESYPAKQEGFIEDLAVCIEQCNFMKAEGLLRKHLAFMS